MPWDVKERPCKQKSTGKSGKAAVVKVKQSGAEEQSSCHMSVEKAQSAVRARHAHEEDIKDEEVLREWIRNILTESHADIVQMGVRLRVTVDAIMADVLTNIRGIKNVITVKQQGPGEELPSGKRWVNIFVTFEDDANRNVYNLKNDISAIEDIDTVIIKNYEGSRWSDVKKDYTGGAASERSDEKR